MKYGEDIAGMAPMMTTKLIELFHSYIAAGSGKSANPQHSSSSLNETVMAARSHCYTCT